MRTRFAVLALAALLFTGCAGTYLLPNVQTGTCYAAVAGDLDWLVAVGQAVDGWRCQGMQVGDAYRTEDSRSEVKMATCAAPLTWNGTRCAIPARAPAPIWATGI